MSGILIGFAPYWVCYQLTVGLFKLRVHKRVFVSDKVVFLELHKTGGTHIGTWLDKLVGGEQVGKHNRLPSALRDRFILGSIRNPWDWYVSLWSYGCKGEGSVHLQSVRPFNLYYCWSQLGAEMGKQRPALTDIYQQYCGERDKPVEQWQSLYADVNNADNFRAWLKLLLGGERVFDIGEGYGFSPISKTFGLMTYRYVKLFTDANTDLYKDPSLASLAGVSEFIRKRGVVDYVIRNDNLEQDLLQGLAMAGLSITGAQKADLLKASDKKINASSHRDTAYYYDQQASDLVARAEGYIVNNYHYTSPLHD